MNVFVLCTGRCGSVTISQAFRQATNFTVGHESAARTLYPLDYPDRHIEVDNRLSWMLGSLGRLFPDACYIHLLREQDAVARSMAARADFPGESTPGFGIGILGEQEDRFEAARRICEIKNDNIVEFLRFRPHQQIWLENLTEHFPGIWDWLGCEGNLEAALVETTIKYNMSEVLTRMSL